MTIISLRKERETMNTYMTLPEITKLYQAKDYPSPSTIFSVNNKAQTEFFKKALKDPNHAITKAVRQGTKVHRALETNEAKTLLEEKVLDVFNKEVAVDIDETWAKEKGLISQRYRYKGKFDGVGVFRGKRTIWDYKKTNKLKTPSQIKTYIMQLGAYAQAHNEMYEEPIEQIALFNIGGKKIEEINSKVFTFDPITGIQDFIGEVEKFYG